VVHPVGGCRPVRAYGEVRAHIASSELGTATPTAFHPRPSGAPDEIECRVLLMLPYTNLTPALAESLRHTMTAERQNRVVVLRKVNILAAAQTDRHMSGASRTAEVIEQPVSGRGFLQLFHFTAGLERKPAFPSRWRAPGSIAGVLRGVWVRAIWRVRPSARTEWESAIKLRTAHEELSQSPRSYKSLVSGTVS
jgi:hypothetical protein